jgi:putative Mn2+ efflux pump MntP
MLIGKSVGRRFGKRAELFGGIALVGLGVMILLQHTGIFVGHFGL